jgi:hypothetical protein
MGALERQGKGKPMPVLWDILSLLVVIAAGGLVAGLARGVDRL